MVKVVDKVGFEEARNADVAVVDFSAGWCGPCKMLAPVLEELSGETDGVDFFNVDVDSNMELAQEFKISSIPAIFVLKKGEVVASEVGFMPKPALADFINKNK